MTNLVAHILLLLVLYQKVSCRVQIDAPTSSASANAFASQEDALQKKFQEILNEKQNLADEVNRMKTEIAEARVVRIIFIVH